MPTKESVEYEWETLIQRLRNREATTQELQETLALLLKYHAKVPKKLDEKYAELFLLLCNHPNTNKKLIIDFDKALERKNPDSVKAINKALMQGLNARG
ncbi:hypothetical protein MNB_SM-5-775 [hydrothermal vent metagenome]|uniref:Uncharacterized protein n=1 Tax=hydrothermal vent metagenome TaxID=652676 RepID=A0A1W1CI70_9ZZZZ